MKIGKLRAFLGLGSDGTCGGAFGGKGTCPAGAFGGKGTCPAGAFGGKGTCGGAFGGKGTCSVSSSTSSDHPLTFFNLWRATKNGIQGPAIGTIAESPNNHPYPAPVALSILRTVRAKIKTRIRYKKNRGMKSMAKKPHSKRMKSHIRKVLRRF